MSHPSRVRGLKSGIQLRDTIKLYLKGMRKPDKYEEVRYIITQIYHENKGRYGYRRITMELSNRGYIVNHKNVQKLMNQLELKFMVSIGKYIPYREKNREYCTKFTKS